MHLNVSNISGSGGCPKRLYPEIREKSGLRRKGHRRYGRAREAQKVGTAVHEIIQHVLKKEPEERYEEYRIVREALIDTKDGMHFPDKINEILGEDYLKGAIYDSLMMKTWKEGADLLNCSRKLLENLENRNPKSRGKWEITAEDSIHKIVEDFIPQREVFGEDYDLHGDVDLIFHWNNIYVLGELKTGPKKEWKEKQWKCQMAIYMDVWTEMFPDCKVMGVIIHRQLGRGFSWVKLEDSWLDQIQDQELTVAGEHCDFCDLKMKCPDSLFAAFNSIR